MFILNNVQNKYETQLFHIKKYHRMFKNIDSAENNPLSEVSRVSPVVFDQNYFQKKIENHWESYLVLYTTKTFYIRKNSTYSCFSKIPIHSDYNYLFIAKIFNVISSNDHLKYILRQLSKQKFNDLLSFKCLPKNILTQNLFLLWLARLEIEKFRKYIQSYYIYIYTSSLLFDFKNIQFQYCKHFFVVQSKDLLFLKICKIRSQIWFHYRIYQHKEEKRYESVPIFIINKENQGICNLDYNTDSFLNNKKKHRDIFLYSNQLYDIKKQLKTFSEQKYINFIKHVIQCNKANKQINLINKINLIVKYWQRSCNIIIHQNNYKYLNYILYNYLWGWSKFRHTRKTSKWKKKRYWNKINNNFYFSDISL